MSRFLLNDARPVIRDLYAIKANIRCTDSATRSITRRERFAPILASLDDWSSPYSPRDAAKSSLGEALTYIPQHRGGLGRFLTNGCIDSNAVERTIRPIALDRKAVPSAGHDAGAENWAVIASLIETSKMNGVEGQPSPE